MNRMNKASNSENFKIFRNISDMPLTEHPTYLEEGINGICTGGSALIEVFSHKQKIAKNDLIIIFPYQLASIREMSDDFSITFFKVSRTMFIDVMSGLCRMTVDFFFYMRKRFRYRLDEAEYERFQHFCSLLEYRTSDVIRIFRRETILHLLRVFYWDLYIFYKNDPEAQKPQHFTHKEEIAFNFFTLVIEHHKEHREVAFYADKLCISPKHLTMVVHEVCGMSAREWIAEHTILEIKALLRDSTLDIKEILRITKFPSQSVLSRYFRRYTGMSPTGYRQHIHM